jgi:hypothetical protein
MKGHVPSSNSLRARVERTSLKLWRAHICCIGQSRIMLTEPMTCLIPHKIFKVAFRLLYLTKIKSKSSKSQVRLMSFNLTYLI